MKMKLYLLLAFLCITKTVLTQEAATPVESALTHANSTANTNNEAKCGGVFMATSKPQRLTSPGWPNPYPSNQNCTWMLTAQQGYRIRIDILTFHTEPCCDHLEVYDGKIEVHRYVGEIRAFEPFVSEHDHLTLKFRSDVSIEFAGFEATFVATNSEMPSMMSTPSPAPCGFDAAATTFSHQLNSPGWPLPYGIRLDCVWRLTAKEGKQVRLDFISFFTEKCCDTLTISDGDREIAKIFGTEIPKDPIVSSSGSLVLQFKSDSSISRNGFQASYKEVENVAVLRQPSPAPCGFTATATNVSKALNSPGYPAIYAASLECEWLINALPGKQILLEFFSFDTESCCDYLTISSGNSNTTRLRGKPSKDLRFVSENGYFLLHFHSDKSHQRYGFQGRFFEVEAGANITALLKPGINDRNREGACGFNAIATETVQTLDSPGWPEKYGRLEECVWRLTAREGKQVELTISYVDTEACCDTLMIYDSNTRLDTVRGSNVDPKVYKSTAGVLLLRFHTDDTVQHTGFQSTFKEVEEITPTEPALASCRFNVNALATEQSLYSPRWPSSYPSSQDCEWVISANPGMNLMIEVLHISTELCCDYLEIFDGDTVVEKLQGFILPRSPFTMQSQTGRFVLRFHSDFSTEYNGFEVKYFETSDSVATQPPATKPATITDSGRVETEDPFAMFTRRTTPKTSPEICGEELRIANSTLQTLRSPNFPMPYPPSLQCNWIIRAPTNKTYVVLDIKEFNIEECCDHVLLMDGGEQVADLSGSTLPFVVYKSKSQEVEIHFHSDDSMEKEGFRLTYSTSDTPGMYEAPKTVGCGFDAEATLEPQYFTSPGWPDEYMNSKSCTWNINAPPDKIVRFEFTRFDTEDCCDYLEIREGKTILRHLQGEVGAEVLTTTTSNVSVTFFSDGSIRRAGFRGSFVMNDIEKKEPSSMLKCYSGLLIFGEGIDIHEEEETARCEFGSSCIEITATGISTLDPYGSPKSVHVSVGQCLPNYVCAGVTCSQIQHRVSPLLVSNLTDCTVRCCNQDMCNAPILPTAKSPTIPPSSAPQEEIFNEDMCLNDDVDFMPGCTYRELYHKAWLCSSLFFNNYPYIDTTQCSNNLQLYRSCIFGVQKRCQVGLKPIFARYNPALDDNFRMAALHSFANLTTIIDPAYDVFCEKNVDEIENLSGGFLSAVSSIVAVNVPFCDLEALTSATDMFYQLIYQLIQVEATEFCRLYSDVLHMVLEVTRACSINDIEQGKPMTQLLRNSKKLLQIIPDLLVEYTIPKCLAFENLDRYQPPEPMMNQPVIFSEPDANGCWSYNVDLMFLIDGSGSVQPAEFRQIIEFVKGVTNSFDLTRNKVGILQYSYWYRNRPIDNQPYLETEIRLGQFTSRLRFGIEADKIKHHGFQSYAAHAIQKAVRVDFASSDRRAERCTKKAIILITDGRATDAIKLETSANEARALGVNIYAVGIKDYVQSQLQIMATGVRGNNDRVYTVENFEDLISLVPPVRDEIDKLLHPKVVVLKSGEYAD
ncbi:cubilin-like [Clavelina lepadiformis]|uniref:cubilin-like n=1 Tax=Clavelina lepadiformis TaxID=159417 RepID=UPI0040420174